MKKAFCIAIATTGLAGLASAWGQGKAFPLSDSDPERTRVNAVALYGANLAVEPQLGEEDRAVYEPLAPLIAQGQKAAIAQLEPQVTPASNAAFDFLLGSLYYSQGDFSSARKWLSAATDKMASFRRAHRLLGLCLVQEGKMALSIPHWLEVVKLGGGDGQSYGLLGYAYLTEGQYFSALKAYEMARLFDPASLDFKRGQAQCLVMTGQNEQAVALFDELIAERPEVSEFWLLQTNAFIALDQRERAVANLELVQSMGKSSWETAMLLGDLYLDREAFGLAAETYRKALDLSATVEVAAALKPLRRLVGFRLFEEADAFLKAVKAKLGSPDSLRGNAEYVVVEAQIQLERGEREAAVAALRKLVETDPLAGQALLLLGDAYRDAENFEQAVFYLERALSAPSAKIDALVALGRLEVERGRFKDALRYLREAQRQEPRDNVQAYLERVEAIAAWDGPPPVR